MRILAGRWKGRALRVPVGRTTRPSAARLRDALFNVLAHGLDDEPLNRARTLDLFAGAGALGFEALSRGAATCAFIERDAEALAALRDNAASLEAEERVRIRRRDAFRIATAEPDDTPFSPPFNAIFIDPPYRVAATRIAQLVQSLARRGWIAPRGVVALERRRGDDDLETESLRRKSRVSAGEGRVDILRLED